MSLPPLPEPRIKYGHEWKVPVAKYDYFIADQLRERDRLIVEMCAQEIPTTWLDPLLTGKDGMGEPPYSCPDIERLLLKLRDRLRALLEEKP